MSSKEIIITVNILNKLIIKFMFDPETPRRKRILNRLRDDLSYFNNILVKEIAKEVRTNTTFA